MPWERVMRWAIAAGALAITAFVAVFGYLIWSHPEFRQRLAATAMAAQGKQPAPRAGVPVVTPAHAAAAASPPPASSAAAGSWNSPVSEVTIAQQTGVQAFAHSTTHDSVASPTA